MATAEIKEVIVLGASGGFGTLFSQVGLCCSVSGPCHPSDAWTRAAVARILLQSDFMQAPDHALRRCWPSLA